MKTIVFFSLSLFTAFCSFAQSGGVLWMGSRSGNAQANEVHAAIRTGYEAFIAGDAATAWNTYSQDVAEIDPGGNITYGLKAIREGFDAFMKMADETPKFTYSNVLVRMLTNDVAIAVWESEADIKIGGQQVGGKTRDMAVLRKINGQWKIEFDSLTPVLPPPSGN